MSAGVVRCTVSERTLHWAFATRYLLLLARAAHRWLTVLVLIPIAGHIFLAAVHPSTRHALTGMLDGRVDREWAATHHPRWGPK